MPLGILVIVLGLVAAGLGGYLLRTAHAVHAVEIDGTIADYREITINGAYARNELKLVGDPHTYTLDRTQYHPALPARLLQSGRAQVWIDQGTTTVVALTLYDELGLNPVKYTTGAYDNPVALYYTAESVGTIAIASGGAVVVIAALWLLIGGLRRRRSPRVLPQPATVREVPQPAFESGAGRIPAISATRPPAPALAAPAAGGAGQEAAGGWAGPYTGLPAQPSTPRSSLGPANAPVPWPGPNSGPYAPQPKTSGPAFQRPATASDAPYGPNAPYAPYPSAPAASSWGPGGAPPAPPTPAAPLAGAPSGPFAQSPGPGAPSGPYAPRPSAGADRSDPRTAASNSGPNSGPGAPSWEAFGGPAAPQPGSAAEPPAGRPYPIPTPAQAAPTMPAPQRSMPLGQAPGAPGAPSAPGAGGAANPAPPAAPGGWADGFATTPPSASMRPPGLRPIGQADERSASGPPAAPAQAGGGDVAELPTSHTPSVPPTAQTHGDLSDFPTERIPAAPNYEPGPVLDDDGGHR